MNCSLNGRRKILRYLIKNGCSATFPSAEVVNVRKNDAKKEQTVHLDCFRCNIVDVFMLEEAHMYTFRKIAAAAVVLNVLGMAVAAEVTVDKEPPKRRRRTSSKASRRVTWRMPSHGAASRLTSAGQISFASALRQHEAGEFCRYYRHHR
jgi:hypothetical protein